MSLEKDITWFVQAFPKCRDSNSSFDSGLSATPTRHDGHTSFSFFFILDAYGCTMFVCFIDPSYVNHECAHRWLTIAFLDWKYRLSRLYIYIFFICIYIYISLFSLFISANERFTGTSSLNCGEICDRFRFGV